MAHKLNSSGVTVIGAITAAEASEWATLIARDIKAGPEFSPQLQALHLAQGGSFGRLGTPSSFHSSSVRELRLHLRRELEPFFSTLVALLKVFPRLEILQDGFRWQAPDTSSSGERWHRDQPPVGNHRVFQGWINLSAEGLAQPFTYIPASQLPTASGFVKALPTAAQIASAVTAQVQPGQIIFFDPTIIHQVAPIRNLPTASVRLHFAFRLSDSNQPLYPLDKVFDSFYTPLLPSGEAPRTWPKLYWSNHPRKLKQVSNAYNPAYLQRQKVKSTGELRTVVPAHFKKLKKADRGRLKAYSEAERRIYLPHPISLPKEEDN